MTVVTKHGEIDTDLKPSKIDMTFYPATDEAAPAKTARWDNGQTRRFGHCSGGPGDVHHGQNCPVAMWSRARAHWDICACECHEDVRNDEDALRVIIAQRHTKATRTREAMMAKKASTTTSKKASTTKARIGRSKPEAKPEVVNSKAPNRKPADCQCKCGGQTKGGRFLPGHDAKLKSALQSAYKAATTEAQRRKIEDEFTSLKWGKYIPAI